MAKLMRKVKEYIKDNKTVILYGLFGGMSTCINLILFIVMIKIGIWYIASSIISYIMAAVFTYWSNDKYVFKNNGRTICKIVKYITNRITLSVIDTVLLYVCVRYLRFSPEKGKTLVMILLLCGNYFISRSVVFK